MMAEPDRLTRFVEAQDDGTFEQALEELVEGRKQSQWMWYVFPQIEGLGNSAKARKYAIADADEARAYLAHEELGPRLLEATEAMMEWAGTMTAQDILGDVDAMKFRSSMTLFEFAAEDDDAQVFADALEAFYDGERCPLTLEQV